MIRSLQPHVIVDNRLDASGEEGGSIYTNNPLSYSGDFASPEQIIPPQGVTDHEGNPIPWEACITLNNNWGTQLRISNTNHQQRLFENW